MILACLLVTPPSVTSFDLHKLATAVAVAETSNCTQGVGRSKNNCHGINGKTGFRVFDTPAESYAAFEEFYPRIYGLRFPTVADARKYTGNPDPASWLKIVATVYNK